MLPHKMQIIKVDMPHSLFKLTQKILGVPHLINKQSFNSITSYLNSRNVQGMKLVPAPMTEEDMPEETPDDLDDINSVGIINICGPLTNKPTGWEMMCGGCSYESIMEQCEELIEEGASCIVMVIDSGGGEAYGCFSAGDNIRKQCDDAGIPLYAYIDGCSASAAYGLTCVADEVIANPYSDVGSIGVLVSLVDTSKQDEMNGVKYVYVTAGKEKIPYAEDGSFRPEFINDLQYKVDFLYEAFCDHVSNYTGLSVEDIKNTEAKTFIASDALKLGLINQIMTNEEFVDYILSKQGASNA